MRRNRKTARGSSMRTYVLEPFWMSFADCDMWRRTIVSLVEVHIAWCLLRLDVVVWCATLRMSVEFGFVRRQVY